MEASQRRRDVLDRRGQLGERHRPARYEARDQTAVHGGGHRRRYPQLRGRLARHVLRVAHDPQQGGIPARQPHHVVLAAEHDAEVPVGDPSL